MSASPVNEVQEQPRATTACLTNEAVDKVSVQATQPETKVLPATHTPASDVAGILAVEPFNEAATRDIIRQVEYYFSDQNLPNDAHLLALSGGDGNGSVSLNEILSWKAMRRFKPRKAVKNVLSQSAVLDLLDDGKRIKRRYPLMLKPHVRPRVDIERANIEKTLAANPHLTKAMLKPTGFEEFYTDPPVTPQQYERDRKLYDPEFTFETRIENAICHYRSRRKMHQETLRVFEHWMRFGGIDTTQQAFNGAFDEEELEGLDKDEKAALKYTYQVNDCVQDNAEEYMVDFEGVALAFLSTEYPSHFKHQTRTVCNVMVNFFNFLLHHDVCPEYRANILAARRAVQLAEPELRKMPAAERSLVRTRGFNSACSILQNREYSSDPALGSMWITEHMGTLEDHEAVLIMQACLAAFATTEQLKDIEERWAQFTPYGLSQDTPDQWDDDESEAARAALVEAYHRRTKSEELSTSKDTDSDAETPDAFDVDGTSHREDELTTQPTTEESTKSEAELGNTSTVAGMTDKNDEVQPIVDLANGSHQPHQASSMEEMVDGQADLSEESTIEATTHPETQPSESKMPYDVPPHDDLATYDGAYISSKPGDKLVIKRKSPFKVVHSETTGLEIIRLEHADDETSAFFGALNDTIVPKMGLMHCCYWETPNAGPFDLPANRRRLPAELRFIVEEDVLNSCEVGMKIDAYVRQLDIGFCWIDRLDAVHPHFYTAIVGLDEMKERQECAAFREEWLAAREQETAEAALSQAPLLVD